MEKEKIRGKRYTSEEDMDRQNRRFNLSEEKEMEDDPYFSKEIDRIEKAIEFALDKHRTQKRKYSNEPYSVHIIGVYNLLNQVTDDENILIAALLHDSIEDKKATKEEIKKLFGEKVLNLVMQCTKDEKKNFHITTKEGLMIKLADVLHNLSTNEDKWYIEKTLYMWHPKKMIEKYFERPKNS